MFQIFLSHLLSLQRSMFLTITSLMVLLILILPLKLFPHITHHHIIIINEPKSRALFRFRLRFQSLQPQPHRQVNCRIINSQHQ